MKKTLLSILSVTLLAAGAMAQNDKQVPPNGWPKVQKRCGTEAPSAEWNNWFNAEVAKTEQAMQSGKMTNTSFTMPIIVHVIHGGQTPGSWPNISQAQINSQIGVLNADFQGTGLNVNSLAATAFSAVGAANCDIHFCAATKNPIGQTLIEPGIERINYVDSGWANPNSFNNSTTFRNYIETVVKPATIWDVSAYLNIWVTDCDQNVGLLGYATFPNGSGLAGLSSVGGAANDGCWLYWGCYGNVGNLMPSYNQGRTATHEIGHWLGLRHIGGDGQPGGTGSPNPNGDCTATDYCNDTPPQKGGFASGQNGQNFGQPTYPLHASACGTMNPNGDMFMNFMDYCDDNISVMFTPNQKARMVTALTSITSVYRNAQTASSATQCNNPAAMPSAITMVDALVCNTMAVASTTNQSTGNPVPSYAWSSSPNAGVTFSPNFIATAPTISFATAGTYTIMCAATNSMGTNTSSAVVTVSVCDVGVVVNSLLATRIGMQPNPTSGKVNIITNLPWAQNLTISVTNVLGQTITSSKYPNVSSGTIEIDLSSNSAGVYFVNIDNGTDKVTKRLVISK